MKVAGLVRALVVDDSPTARLALKAALQSDGTILVVGEAQDGAEALRLAQSLKPDVVLMDVYLRGQSGLDVAAELMSTSACPIIAVTAANPSDPALVFRGMDVGVLEICLKPPAPDDPGYPEACRRLTRLVKVLSQVPVVHRFSSRSTPVPRPPPAVPEPSLPGVVLLGASTGGPPVVRKILELLPRPFPLPVVLVQHMLAGFGGGFAKWLADATGLKVVVVERTESLQPGVVYLASDSQHLRFNTATSVRPNDDAPVRFQRPSIDVLFQSAAQLVRAPMAAALLTGMGNDGAEGLLALREAGAVTIVQAPETCVVDSMPTAAMTLGAATRVLTPKEIAAALQQHALTSSAP